MVKVGDAILAIAVGAAFYFLVWKNQKFQDWINQIKVGQGGGGGDGGSGGTTTDGGGGTTTDGGGTTTDGGGGPTTGASGKSPYPTLGGTWQFKQSPTTTRHYASDGSSGTTESNATGMGAKSDLVGIVYYTHPSSCSGGHGDEADIKMWGPSHSDGACCWCIVNINGAGKVCSGGEGPHPTTNKCATTLGNVGSVAGKTVGLLHAIWKSGSGAHSEAWIDTGGGFKKIGVFDGQCGASKKSSTPSSGQQVQFRCDCSGVKIQSATVYEISPGGGGASTTGGTTTKTPSTDTTTTTPSTTTKDTTKTKAAKIATIARLASIYKADTSRIPYIPGVKRLPEYTMTVNGKMLDYYTKGERPEEDCGFHPNNWKGAIEQYRFKTEQSRYMSKHIPFSEPIANVLTYYDDYVNNPELLQKKAVFKVANCNSRNHSSNYYL